MTATAEERPRRYLSLRKRGFGQTFQELVAEIEERDRNDSTGSIRL